MLAIKFVCQCIADMLTRAMIFRANSLSDSPGLGLRDVIAARTGTVSK